MAFASDMLWLASLSSWTASSHTRNHIRYAVHSARNKSASRNVRSSLGKCVLYENGDGWLVLLDVASVAAKCSARAA